MERQQSLKEQQFGDAEPASKHLLRVLWYTTNTCSCAGCLGVQGTLRSFVVRCTVAPLAFSPTGLTFKIAQLCMNGKQYPLPSGPGVTYFISRAAEHNQTLCVITTY